MSFIKLKDAIERGIIPDEGIIGGVGMDDEIYHNNGEINAGCGFAEYAGIVIKQTQLKCSALTDDGKCTFTSDDPDTATECKVLQILGKFYENKKEAA